MKVIGLGQPPDSGLANLDEVQLIEQAKQDPEAMAEVYHRHYRSIYAYVLRRVGDANDTADVVAEVFLTMVRYLPKYECRGAPFRSWLLRLATTQVNRWVRRRNRTRFWRSLCCFGFEPPTLVKNEVSDLADSVRESLLSLPHPIQSVVSLYYFEDESIQSIARILECSEGTIKSRLSRGREILLRKLLKCGEPQ